MRYRSQRSTNDTLAVSTRDNILDGRSGNVRIALSDDKAQCSVHQRQRTFCLFFHTRQCR